MTETQTVRVAQVGRDLDLGDGHEPDARIRDLAADDAADLLAQQLIDPRVRWLIAGRQALRRSGRARPSAA